jgi:hypothetical protein
MSDMEKAEQERQMAEEGRVDRSLERVANEDSRIEAEDARVTAEDSRVSAETKRADTRSFYLKTATAIALPLAFIALIPSLIGIYLVQKEADHRTTENRKAIVYICSTTGVLDSLVVQVAQSLELNIKSGLYQTLVANGTLPPRAIKEAQENLIKYRQAHKVLSDTKPCTDLH